MAEKIPNPVDLDTEKYFNYTDIQALKERIKIELQRRHYLNDISNFGNSEYDFSNKEKKSDFFQTEHINKIVRPMQAIHPLKIGLNEKYDSKNKKYISFTDEDYIPELKTLTAYLAACELEQPICRSAINHCMSACSGMCVTGCANSCTSCNGCNGCNGCSGCGSCSSSGDSGGSGGGSSCAQCVAACGNSCTAGCVTGCLSGCSGCGNCGDCSSSGVGSSRGCDTSCTDSCSGRSS